MTPHRRNGFVLSAECLLLRVWLPTPFVGVCILAAIWGLKFAAIWGLKFDEAIGSIIRDARTELRHECLWNEYGWNLLFQRHPTSGRPMGGVLSGTGIGRWSVKVMLRPALRNKTSECTIPENPQWQLVRHR